MWSSSSSGVEIPSFGVIINPTSETIETEQSEEKNKEIVGEDESLQESSKLSHPWEESDVIFLVEEKEIHANRSILCIWSPVFHVMFKAHYKEEKLEAIPLPGKKYGDMIKLFELCHVPKAKVTEDNVHTVLPLAEEYQMDAILDQCETVLLSQERSIQNLILSKCYRFTHLERFCRAFAKVTPFSRMSKEGFDEVDSETRASILEFKVERLEPLVDLLKELRELALCDKPVCSRCSPEYCLACGSRLEMRGAVLDRQEEDLNSQSALFSCAQSAPSPGPPSVQIPSGRRNRFSSAQSTPAFGFSVAGSPVQSFATNAKDKQKRTLCLGCTTSRLEKIYHKLVPFVPHSLLQTDDY